MLRRRRPVRKPVFHFLHRRTVLRPHGKILAVVGVAFAFTILLTTLSRLGSFQAQAGPGFCCEVRGNPCTVKTLQECINVNGAYTPVSQNVCDVVVCNLGGGGAHSSSSGPVCGNNILEGTEQCDGASLPPKPAGFSCPADVNAFKTQIDVGAYANVGSCCTTSTYCGFNNTGGFNGPAWCLTMYVLNGRSLVGQSVCTGTTNLCGANNTCGSNCKCQGSSSSAQPTVCGYLYTFNDPPGSTTTTNQVGGGGTGTLGSNMQTSSCAPPPYSGANGCLKNGASPNAGVFNGPGMTSPPNAPYSVGGQFMMGSAAAVPLNGYTYAGCTDRYVALNVTQNAAVLLDSTNHVQVAGTGIVSAPISTNTWHQITYTWDGSIGTLYIDGAVAGTSTTQPGQSNAQVGQAFNCLESRDGLVDDYFAYPGALTASQISAIKGGQMPSFPSGGYCPYCGNGTKDGSEQCDDNNNTNGDGCSAGCVIESGFQCSVPGGSSSSASGAGTSAGPGCVIAGCRNEICLDASQSPPSGSCTPSRLDRCYQVWGKCEKQSNGSCSWTQDSALTSCLKCGDGVCDSSETFMTDFIVPGVCAEDCGYAPFMRPPPDCVICGDNRCENNENAQNCPKDCASNPHTTRQNPPDCLQQVCGDGFCDAFNNERTTCPQDCN